MKIFRTITFIAFFCNLSTNLFAQNSLTDGLVGYYKFSGNTGDSSGNNNHATKYAGATLTTDKDGNSNGAYTFDGTSLAYMEAANYSTLNTANMNNFAISVWFNASSGTSSNTNRNIVQMQDGLNRNYTVTYNKTTSKIDFYNWNGPSSIDNIKFSSSITVAANVWHHLVLRIDSNNNTELFINNTLAGSSTQTVIKPVSPSLVIGRHPVVSGTWNFLGKIDEIRVYNRYLTNANISMLANGCSMTNSIITYTGPTTFCAGKNILLNANLQGNAYTYSWKLDGNNISGASASSYLATQQGVYTLKIDSGSCSSTSSPISVIVNSLPTVTATSIPAFIHHNSSTINLVGSPSGGIFSGPGVLSNVFTPNTLGAKSISYTYTDSKGCANSALLSTIIYDTTLCSIIDTIHRYDTLKVTVTDTLKINVNLTNVNNPNLTNTIRIYPNPTNSVVTIDYGNYNLMTGYQLKIVNSIGQTVYSSPINQQQINLDLSTWTGKGIYFVDLINNLGQKVDTRKIVLQ